MGRVETSQAEAARADERLPFITRGASSGGEGNPQRLSDALRAPELWVIVALAAALRLWHVGASVFLADQAELMRMARLSLRDGLIPVTGIPSSISTLNPPASIFALLPFAALGSDPLPAVIGTALWNVFGVALAYLFARRYFNRIVAAVAALLFAAGGAAVAYSRFIWQQNLLPPVVLLWAVFAFAGATRDRGRMPWLAPAVGCAVIATQLHPTAVVFLGLTVVAVLLAPRWPRRLDWLLTAAIAALLLLPTLVFEQLTGGYDLKQLRAYFGQGSHIDLSVGRALWGILDGPDTRTLSAHGLTHELSSPAGLVTLALAALIAAGYVALTARVVAPAWQAWRGEQGRRTPVASPAEAGVADTGANSAGGARRLVARSQVFWRWMRGDRAWKVHLLLWLWITIPILALIRHSSLVANHYLMTLYPAIFIPAALAVAWVWERRGIVGGAQTGAASPIVGEGASPRSSGPRRWLSFPAQGQATGRMGIPALLLLALVAALVVGQSVRDVTYYSWLASSGFNQYATFGYPLDALRALNQRLDTLAQQTHARSVEIVDPQSSADPKIVEYMLVDGRANRTSFGGACLILPAEGPALIAASPTGQPAADALARLPGASRLTDIPMSGTAPWTVWEYAPSTPTGALPGDHPIVQATFRDDAGNAFRLDAAARDGSTLRLRWTLLAVTNPPYEAQLGVAVTAALGGTATAQGNCFTQQWRAGQTLYMWLPLPAGAPAPTETITVRASDLILGPTALTFAGLHLLTGFYYHHTGRALVAQPASDSGLISPGAIQPDGSYTLPVSALGE